MSRHIPQALSQLSGQDCQELYDSGITNATIEQYAPRTESSAAVIARLLNRYQPATEDRDGALVYPVYDSNGQAYSDFVQVKLHTPRRTTDGKAIKYEIPAGCGFRIGFSPDAERTHDVSQPLVITEGIKKAMVLDQMGYAVAILFGVDCWSEPNADDRPLHSDFSDVPLDGRTVVILFDTDEQRNPYIHRSRSLLTQRLAERGARVRIMELPPEKDEAGEFIKVGVDDFIVRHGADKFQQRFNTLTAPPQFVSLDDYRTAMTAANLRASQIPGVYRCAAPTGVGKSYSMLRTLRHNYSYPALIVQPTHQQNTELVNSCKGRSGLVERTAIYLGRTITFLGRLAAYPSVSPTSCKNFEAVNRAAKCGIKKYSICKECQYQATCHIRQQTAQAAKSLISVGTHARFRLSNSMRDKRHQIHIHEDIAGILAPTMPLTGDFHVLQSVLVAVKERFRLVPEPKVETVAFIDSLLQITRRGIGYHSVNETAIYGRPKFPKVKMPTVNDIDVWEEIYREITARKVHDQIGNTLRFCQYVVSRRARRVVIHCDAIRENVYRTITVHLKSAIPKRPRKAAYILYDATLPQDTAERLLGHTITDITPHGKLKPCHRIVQHPDADVKIGTSPERVRMILQSLLFLQYPDARRVGIICHKKHRAGIEAFVNNLPPDQRERIVLVEHFHGTISRGSNRFHQERLDAILVLGTPRVPKNVIRDRVVQCHACPHLDSDYSSDSWCGYTESGQVRMVDCPSYRNHDWHRAMREIVGSELIQAIGRGRIYLEDGVPLVVLASNLDTGLRRDEGLYLADEKLPKATKMVLRDLKRVVDALYAPQTVPPTDADGSVAVGRSPELRATFPNNTIERILPLALSSSSAYVSGGDGTGDMPLFDRLTAKTIAERCEVKPRTMTHKLRILERRGLVTKVGQRGGYTISRENWQRIVLVYRSASGSEPNQLLSRETSIPASTPRRPLRQTVRRCNTALHK